MQEKHNKLSKKEIQEDQLVTTYAKFLEFFGKFRLQIYSVLGGIVVVVVGLFLYTSYMESNNEKANELIAKVLPVYDSGNFKLALEGKKGNFSGFREIVDEFGGTETGQVSKIYFANCLYHLGKIAEAKDAYEDYTGSNEILQAASKAGVAACVENEKNYEEAAKLYKSASEVYENNPLNGEYLVKAGINLVAAGKTSEAQELFEKVIADYKTSSSLEEANRQLAIINSK